MKFSVKASPYAYKIHFIVSKDDKEIAEHATKLISKTDVSELKNVFAVVFYDDELSPLVCLRDVPRTPKEYGLFFHEVQHACMLVGKYVGMGPEELSGETFPHFIESIVVKALTKINKLCSESAKSGSTSSSPE